MKKFDWIVVGLIILVVMSSQVYSALAPADSLINIFSIDDAYYYFKTAQNISLGYGVTFDRINPANGFHPLWMAICVEIYAIFNHDLITPLRAIAIVMGVLNAGTSILLYFLLRKVISEWVAGLGALFWALTPVIHTTTSTVGLETGLSIFSIVLFLYLVIRYRENADTGSPSWLQLIGLGFSAVLVIFSRLDNIFFVAVVGLWLILRELKVSSFFYADLILSALSVIISFVLRIGINSNYGQFLQAIFIMLWVAALIRPIVFSLMKISQQPKEASRLSILLRLIIASAISTVLIGTILITLSYTRIIYSLPRSTLIFDAVISFLLLTGYRMIWTLKKNTQDLIQATNLVWWIKTHWKRFIFEGVAFFGPVVILVVGYLVWNISLFGTPLPVSGQIKHWWGTLPNTVYASSNYLINLLGLGPTKSDPMSLLTIPLNNIGKQVRQILGWEGNTSVTIMLLILVGLTGIVIWLLSLLDKGRFRTLLRKTALLPLVVGCFAQFSYYEGSNYVSARFWYWIADSLAIMILFVILIDLIYDRLIRWRLPSWLLNVIIGTIGVMIIGNYVIRSGFTASYSFDPVRHDWYMVDIHGLERETEPGSIIGMTGGGTVAYFIENRTIMNLDGLMNSYPYFLAMQKGDVSAILVKEKLAYIFSSDTVINFSDPYQVLFKDNLQKIKIIWGEEDFTLFRYLPTLKQK